MLSTGMNYYNINNFVEDEQVVDVTFNVPIAGNKLYKKTLPGKKLELPLFAVKFLMENGHCQTHKNKEKLAELVRLINDLYAQADIVDLKNRIFYSFETYKANQDEDSELQENEFLSNTFLSRMGSFARLMVKDSFGECDMEHLSYEEKLIVLKARKPYQEHANYKFK